MTNADKFQQVFGIYATELWAKPEKEFLEWLNASTEPEREKGKWVVINKFDDCLYAKCNQCNVTQIFYYGKPLTNYCPNCGSYNGGDENRENSHTV